LAATPTLKLAAALVRQTAIPAFWSALPMSLDPDQVFGDRDAPTIDKAIASSAIAQYVSGKLQTLTGHFQTLEPNQFASCIKNGAVNRPR
jgi:hypothetical protein